MGSFFSSRSRFPGTLYGFIPGLAPEYSAETEFTWASNESIYEYGGSSSENPTGVTDH
jgi:hypothetical protein